MTIYYVTVTDPRTGMRAIASKPIETKTKAKEFVKQVSKENSKTNIGIYKLGNPRIIKVQ